MEARIYELIVHYGLAALFIAQMFGIFGVPIPDELLLTVAGTLVRKGQLGPMATATAAFAGCVTGITFSYVLGRTIGLAAIERFVHAEDSAVTRAQHWFNRFGGWLVTFGFFIPGVRHVTAIAAGSAPMTFGRFAAFAYPGAALWCGVFLTAGYLAGDKWHELAAALRRHELTELVAGTILLTAYIALTRRRVRS
jgi:membrane protein DedA with SNARE-associated domain